MEYLGLSTYYVALVTRRDMIFTWPRLQPGIKGFTGNKNQAGEGHIFNRKDSNLLAICRMRYTYS
jgi:hypothetical protein